MRFLRSWIAVGLLVAFGACYALPAITTPKPRASHCCRRDGHACCRKSSGAGSVWTAAPECGQTCRLPVGLAVPASPLVAPRGVAVDVAVFSEKLDYHPAAPTSQSSYFASLHQRPPPPGF